jgi:HAD superfamily hydrolase (TIGR01509 family)
MKYQAVLFDLDGVLVDACEWHYTALNEAMREIVGFEISRHDHETKYNGLPTNVKLSMMNIDEPMASRIGQLKQSLTMKTIHKNAKIMMEKCDLHRYLKANGIKIACVTNSISTTARLMLEKTGQLEYMDLIVSNEDVKNNKPSPDCYNYAIEKLKVDPLKCLCVEDSPKGIQAAINSRANAVWQVKNPSEVNSESYRRFVNEDFDTYGG